VTLYDEHHFFHPDPLNRYSLGTKSKARSRDHRGQVDAACDCGAK